MCGYVRLEVGDLARRRLANAGSVFSLLLWTSAKKSRVLNFPKKCLKLFRSDLERTGTRHNSIEKHDQLMNKKFLPNALLSKSTNAGGVMPTIHPGSRRVRPTGRFGAAFLILAALIGTGVIVLAQAPPNATIPRVPNPPLSSDLASLPGDLRAVRGAGAVESRDFVKDPVMARALGKALFWDMQVGSDGVQACASCHFRAGADPRSKNQVSPGLKHSPDADLTYSTGRRSEPSARGRGLPPDAARDSGRPRRARSDHRQQRRRRIAGHPSPS